MWINVHAWEGLSEILKIAAVLQVLGGFSVKIFFLDKEVNNEIEAKLFPWDLKSLHKPLLLNLSFWNNTLLNQPTKKPFLLLLPGTALVFPEPNQQVTNRWQITALDFPQMKDPMSYPSWFLEYTKDSAKTYGKRYNKIVLTGMS